MYDVFAERLPKYHQECLKEFNEREPETLIHGDYHCGNHTFGVGQNEGQVIAFDFQATGKSLVTLEIVNLLPFSKEITDFQEIEDIIKGNFDHKLYNFCFESRFKHHLSITLVFPYYASILSNKKKTLLTFFKIIPPCL